MGKARNLDAPTTMGSLDGNQWRRQRILDIERRIRHSDGYVFAETRRLTDEAIRDAGSENERAKWRNFRDYFLKEATKQHKATLKNIRAIGELIRAPKEQ